MQIQNPTAVMIARTAVAQDDITGDGTTSMVLCIGELMKRAEGYLQEGLHTRVICEGFDIAKNAALEYLEKCKVPVEVSMEAPDRDVLTCTARTSLRTKLYEEIADQFTDIIVEAVTLVRQPGQQLDLNIIEVLHMKHKLDNDSRLVRGLVLDHGARHPDMPKHLENCYILTCNISLEYEKSEVNSGFFYSSAEERERLVAAEREVTDERVRKVIALKKQVCDGTDKSFVIINQKGIDPLSLDLLAKEGIIALRRAKKRNMERLMFACGGQAINSELELEPEALGYAGKVYEHTLGDDVYTFVEDVKHPTSCTILIKGPSDHVIAQLKDAVRDGMRAVKNVLDDAAVVPGAGAFEIGLERYLMS